MVITTTGARGLTFTSPVRMPTFSAPHCRPKSAYFWLESALSGVVYAMRRPRCSAAWIANSATRVLPEPVGAETITDLPSRIAEMARSWKSSRGNA